MMVRNALVLLLLVTLGWGCGRSKMVIPPHGNLDAAVGLQRPDSSVPTPEVAGRDGSPLLPDGVPLRDFGPILPDTTSPPVLPDAAPDLRSADLPSEGPVPPDALPDRPTPILPDGAIPPDGRVPPPDAVPSPDLTPPPDLMPPPQQCVAGGACTSDCTATCGTFGVMACGCTSGTLSCTTCQVLPITISPDPCPQSPTGKECTTDGVACIAFTNGSISGACICTLPLGDTVDRWSCILR